MYCKSPGSSAYRPKPGFKKEYVSPDIAKAVTAKADDIMRMYQQANGGIDIKYSGGFKGPDPKAGYTPGTEGSGNLGYSLGKVGGLAYARDMLDFGNQYTFNR